MRKFYIVFLIHFFMSSLLCNSFSKATDKPIASLKTLPITGFCLKGFEAFDKVIPRFLTKRGLPGATLAIIKNGKLLVKRGYGWSDKKKTRAILPDDFLRIASITKVFTTIAIKNLIKTNKISYETPIIDFLNNQATIADQNIKKITVFHLLFHQGGWNSEQSLDPLLSLGMITSKLHKDIENLGPHDILRYAIENITLDFIPGTSTNYSNLGYSILGRIIEEASQSNYLTFINNIICKPLNIKVEIGPTRLSAKSPSEIDFYQSHDLDLKSDAISLKAADASFGLITSAPNICKVLNNYWIDGDKKSTNEQRQFTITGSMPGTIALARQRYSDASIVVLINGRDNNNPEMDNENLKQLIDNTANKCGI